MVKLSTAPCYDLMRIDKQTEVRVNLIVLNDGMGVLYRQNTKVRLTGPWPEGSRADMSREGAQVSS